jgi:hypothetical protein
LTSFRSRLPPAEQPAIPASLFQEKSEPLMDHFFKVIHIAIASKTIVVIQRREAPAFVFLDMNQSYSESQIEGAGKLRR